MNIIIDEGINHDKKLTPENIELFHTASLCYLVIPTQWYVYFMLIVNTLVFILMVLIGLQMPTGKPFIQKIQ